MKKCLIIVAILIIFNTVQVSANSEFTEQDIRQKEIECRNVFLEVAKIDNYFVNRDYNSELSANVGYCFQRPYTYWGLRLHLLEYATYLFNRPQDNIRIHTFGNETFEYEIFNYERDLRLIFYRIDNLQYLEPPKENIINRIILFFTKRQVKDFHDKINHRYAFSVESIKQEVVFVTLDYLNKNGKCDLFIELYEYFLTGEEVDLDFDIKRKEKLTSIYEKCNLLHATRFNEEIQNLIGRPFYKFYIENSLFSKRWYYENIGRSEKYIPDVDIENFFRKNKKIDVFIYNDQTLSKEEFFDRIAFFNMALDDLPEYEFLGKQKNSEEPLINFVAKYIDWDETICYANDNTLSYTTPRCNCLYDDESSFLETKRQAHQDGADVYFIITKFDCLSFAIPGFYSVISWPQQKPLERPDETNNYSDIIVNIRNDQARRTTINDKTYFDYYPYVIFHELGHLVWGLADEYYYRYTHELNKKTGFPNCARNEVEARAYWNHLIGHHDGYNDFSGRFREYLKVGFNKGCGTYYGDVYRPTQHSLMNDQRVFSEEANHNSNVKAVYGAVNDHYITRFMEEYEQIPMTPYLASYGHLMLLNKLEDGLSYEDSGLNYLSARRDLSITMEHLLGQKKPEEFREYVWKHYDVDDEIILTDRFNFPSKLYVSRPEYCSVENESELPSSCLNYESQKTINRPATIIAVPYHNRGARIDISKNDEVLLSINLSNYLDYCGDGVCSDRESYYTCPQDCEEEILTYGFIEGKQRDFHIYKGTISGTGQVDVVYSSGGCLESLNNCVEFIEENDKIKVFMKQHSDVMIYNSEMYDIHVHYTTGVGNVFFETETSKLLITPTEIKTSYSDWHDLPKITRTIHDDACSYIFDVNTDQKLLLICENE